MAGRDIKQIIPAGTQNNVSAAGDYIHLKSATGTVRVELANGQSIDMTAGDKVRSPRFKGFVAHNDTGADITAVFVVGEGDFTQGAVTGTITLVRPSNFNGVADVALVATVSAAILAADTTRSSVTLTNITTSAGEARIGGAGSVGAAQGTPLQPGESMTISFDMGASDAIWGHSVAGATIAISVAQD